MSHQKFLELCTIDDLVNAKSLYDSGCVSSADVNTAINRSSKNLNVLRWLCQLREANYSNIIILFVSSCGIGNSEIVELMNNNIIKDVYIIKCGLILACHYNNLEIIKLLYNRWHEDLCLYKSVYFQTETGPDTQNIISAGYEVFTGPHASSNSHFGCLYEELFKIAKYNKYNEIIEWLENINS